MATNLALDDGLIEEARRAGSHKSKKEAVTAALEEYVRKRQQIRILDAFGTFPVDPTYDYKKERQRTGKSRSGKSLRGKTVRRRPAAGMDHLHHRSRLSELRGRTAAAAAPSSGERVIRQSIQP